MTATRKTSTRKTSTRKTSTRKTATRTTAPLLGLVALALAGPHAAHAQLTTLATFNGSNGANSYAGLTLSSGTLYGTTRNGGAGTGTVFSIPAGGGSLTTLADFTGSNGYAPTGNLTPSGGTLYGTTQDGGEVGYGTVFSMPMGGGPVTTLASFSGAIGQLPFAGLTLGADGKTLYGTTGYGGAGGNGTVFSLPVGGGSLTTLAAFNGTNGSVPEAGLTLSADGKTLYGTTVYGGANMDGVVFSIPAGGGAITTLADFTGTNGKNPYGGVTLSADGKTLYGTTEGGGANGDGTVFSLSVAPEPSAPITLALGVLSAAGLMLRAHRRSRLA